MAKPTADANHAMEMTTTPSTNADTSPPPSSSWEEMSSPEPEENDQPSIYLPPTVDWRGVNKQRLQRAAMDGDWEAAKEIFDTHPDLKTARIDYEGMTALHLAAKCGRSEFVGELVRILNPQELEIEDQGGRNVLHHAAIASDVKAARVIVQKNSKLVDQVDYEQGFTPLYYAARWRHPSKSKEMLEFLYEKTDPKVYKAPETAPGLIVAITASGCHGIALRILKLHPELALARNTDKWSILHILATQPSAFSSGRKKTSLLCQLMNSEAEKQQQKRHKDARDLVDYVCQQLLSFATPVMMEYFLPDEFHAILHLATVHGAVELVEICLQYFPNLTWYASSSDGRLLLHVAVEHRRVEIYNLAMSLVGENAGVYAGSKVEGDNNILHLAANLAPTPQLHSVPGPAFQMQRELQWFKAVESVVYTEERHAKNIEEKCTPEELFFKKHDALMKDAKEWMKDTSNSCMVVAALVATVAFASMITVPGGNNSNTGTPILSKQKVFIMFSVANALSMISAAIALLLFLSLQTSRYTDEDFLDSLPRNLLSGLLALFVAVATMMIAFGTAIGLELQTRIKWVYIPITVVACIPAIIFTWLHLPLLAQTILVTSGPVIFGRQRNPKPRCLNKIGYILVPNDHPV